MANKIGLVLALDGEKEFQQGLSNAKKETQSFKAELKNLDSQYEGSANSVEALSKKQETLAKQLDACQKSVDAADKGLKNAKSTQEAAAKNYDKLEKEVKDAESALEKLEKEGKENTQEFKDQKAQLDKLNTALKDQGNECSKCEGKVSDWNKKLNQAETELNKTNTAISKNEKYLNEAQNSTSKCATSIDEYGKEVKGASDQTGLFGSVLTANLAGGAIQLGVQMLQQLGQAAIEAAKKMVEMGSEFEAAMSNVQAISGASGASFDQLTEKAKELGETTKYSATEAADAMSYMALAGWDTKETLDGIDGVLNLAAASDMDLADASDIVTDNLSAFNMEADQSDELVDQMAYAMSNANTDTEQLGEAYKNCATTATQLGWDLDDVTAALMVMADNGAKGGEAGTALNSIMTRLANNTNGCADSLHEYGVEVYDSEGNLNDLGGILSGMQDIWGGLSDQEKANIAYTTAGKSAQSELMAVLGDSTGSLEEYTAGLSDCTGTAQEMADVMQDNLQGDLTKMDSALEGLGVAVYQYVEGPLRGVVQGVTDIISGITDFLTVEEDELSNFISDTQACVDIVESTLSRINDDMSEMTVTSSKLEAYKQTIEDLNEKEDKNAFEKYQIQTVVEDLEDEIPELAAAFDEETGSINLTNEEILDLIENSQNAACAEDLAKDLAEAELAQKEAANALEDANTALSQAQDDYNEKVDAGRALIGFYSEDQKTAQQNVRDAKDTQKEASEAYDEASQKVEELTAQYDEYEGKLEESVQATDDVAQSEEELSQTAEEVAASIQASSETAADSVNHIKEAYDETMQSIQEDLENKIDLTSKFDAGEQTSIDEMMENLESQVQGLEEYKQNLEYLIQELTGKVSPEFIQYLQDMGTDGAATLDGLVQLLQEDNGEQQILEVAQKYTEALDLSEDIAEIGATNQTAYEQAMGDLGSTEVDFSELRDSISTAITEATDVWGDLDESTEQALNDTIDTAEQMGIQIPEGLASSIESGEKAPEEAIGDLKGAIEGTFEGFEEIAAENGIEIPEGLADGIDEGGQAAVDAMDTMIESISERAGTVPVEISKKMTDGEDDVEEAAEELAEAGTDAVEEASDVYQEAAEGYAEAMAEGITGSEDLIAAAVQEMAEAGTDALDENTDAYEDSGSTSGEAYAEGVESSATGEAKSVGNEIAKAATNALKDHESDFKNAGSDAGSAYAQGLSSQSSNVSSEARSIASAALSAVQGYQNSFSSVGSSMMAGMANGISAGRSSVINAAVNVAASALSAAQSELGIHSPSKKFREKVGRRITDGVAFGIADRTKYAAKEAQKMSKQVYQAASSWLKDYKKNHKVAIEDEVWYWNEVLGHVAQGTSAYEKVYKKYTDSIAKMIKQNTDRYTTTGSGDSVKRVKKSAAEYNAEIYSAAQTYLSHMETVNNMSLKNELQYWKSIKSTLKKGTDAWYDAKEQINRIKEQIGTVSNAKSLLSAYTTYFELSAKAEMEYWDAVRKQYKAGTDERLEADQAYLEARESYYDQLEDLEKEYADSCKDIEEDLADSIARLQSDYNDTLQQRIDTIASAYSLFDEFTSESVSGQELLFNLESQAAGYEAWSDALDVLEERGILSDELLTELTEMGPSQLAAIYALTDLTDEELTAYQDAYDRKMDAATKQAEEDTADLKSEMEDQIKELQDQAQQDLNELKETYNNNCAAINTTITSELEALAKDIKNIAEDETTALVAAMTGQAKKSGVTKSSLTSSTSSSSSKSSSSTTKSKDPILEIINTGKSKKTLTAQERKQHHKLFEYLVDNYQRAGTNAMYQDLGTAFGLSVGKVPSASKKDKILQKLKDNGYKSGGTIRNDQYAWMDEAIDDVGPELIVRKSDNAILTRVKPGDEIIDAHSTDNLLQLAKIGPDQFLNDIAQQQQAAASYFDDMNPGGGMAAMNNLMATEVSTAPGGMVRDLSDIVDLMNAYLPYLAKQKDIYLDSGELVGAMSDDISNDMAMRSRRLR